jgi:hypothetical protein
MSTEQAEGRSEKAEGWNELALVIFSSGSKQMASASVDAL